MAQFLCKECLHLVTVEDHYSGKTVVCPSCKKKGVVGLVPEPPAPEQIPDPDMVPTVVYFFGVMAGMFVLAIILNIAAAIEAIKEGGAMQLYYAFSGFPTFGFLFCIFCISIISRLNLIWIEIKKHSTAFHKDTKAT